MRFIFWGLLSLLTTNTIAQSIGQFVKDIKSGCQVWSDNYSPDDSVSWKGDCKDNYAEGWGTLTWFQHQESVATYVGTMKHGNPNGKGKYIINNFGILQGDFVDGLLNGLGEAEYFNYGQKQIGTFIKGVLNGQGEIIYTDGRKLKGNFSDGILLDLSDPYLSLLKKNRSSLIDSANIYQGDGDSNLLFYYTLTPPITKAVIVLFPSSFESCESVISSNKNLIQECYDKGIMTVVLSSNFNRSLSLDKFAFEYINKTFTEIIKTFNVPKEKFIVCGLSLGGMNALRYTEMSQDANYQTSIKPLAVIGVDPPVDEIGLYKRAIDEINLYQADSIKLSNGQQNALAEGKMLTTDFIEMYGGSPDQFPNNYILHSPYIRTEKDGGNAKYLLKTPVKIYCDPDINWHLTNRQRDLYHINASDQTALINFLTLNGNNNAHFKSCIGKGYRLDGSRHPHSWSIIDTDDCIKWIEELIK
ncbi:MAG TPA: hypothetical protein PL185_02460 [Flavobacteriales bacterium]|nr:hypothetical protein [Flavobacteriales bacterium]